MSKTLKTIQIIAKVGEIICLVLLIAGCIGVAGTVIALIALACGLGSNIKVGTWKFVGVEVELQLTQTQMYVAVIFAGLACVGMVVLAWFARRYLIHEQQAGTPFTLAGSREIFRLGIINLVVSVVLGIALAIAAGVCAAWGEPLSFNLETNSMFSSGLLLLLFALIFKYGAELKQPETPETDAK